MDFSFHPELSKELILSRISEEQIMEYYLNIPVKKGLVVSPLRDDKNPTCSFFRKGGVLMFKDFAIGKNYTAIGVVMEKYKVSYLGALKIIANDFNIIPNKHIQKNEGFINPHTKEFKESKSSVIQITPQPFTSSELKWWGDFGITEDILKHFRIYSCKHVFLQGKLSFSSSRNTPIFGYYGGILDNIERWRCYFPTKKSFRFLTNWPASLIQGYKQLPPSGDLLIITKSLKDVACLYSFNITAIAPNSELLFIDDTTLKDLKQRFKKIVVFYDNDLPGINGMLRIKKKYPELKYFFIPKSLKAKDFSDLYKEYGREKTKAFINDALNFLQIYE